MTRGVDFTGTIGFSYVGILSSSVKPFTQCFFIESRVGPNTQDRAEHLTAETGHPFEDVMATFPPTGFAEQVAGNSSDTQSAFRQLWRKYSV